jgi:hypothetical protein
VRSQCKLAIDRLNVWTVRPIIVVAATKDVPVRTDLNRSRPSKVKLDDIMIDACGIGRKSTRLREAVVALPPIQVTDAGVASQPRFDQVDR